MKTKRSPHRTTWIPYFVVSVVIVTVIATVIASHMYDYMLDATCEKIVFAGFTRNDPRSGDIYTVCPTTGTFKQLTFTPGEDNEASWSPDGRHILFTSTRNSNEVNPPPVLYIMDADGGNQRPLATSDTFGFLPKWSSDGQKIVFNSAKDSIVNIYSVNADGSDWRQLTHLTTNGFRPTWSPDGQRIAYGESGYSLEEHDIVILDIRDGTLKQIANTPTTQMRFPQWSPDGTSIIYSDGPIHVVNINTHEERIIGEGSDAIWSPDGSLIAFTTQSGGISVVDPWGNPQSQFEGVGGDSFIWSPDGKQLAHTHYTINGEGIRIINKDGSHAIEFSFGLHGVLGLSWKQK